MVVLWRNGIVAKSRIVMFQSSNVQWKRSRTTYAIDWFPSKFVSCPTNIVFQQQYQYQIQHYSGRTKNALLLHTGDDNYDIYDDDYDDDDYDYCNNDDDLKKDYSLKLPGDDDTIRYNMTRTMVQFPDDLRPPWLNWKRGSILFDSTGLTTKKTTITTATTTTAKTRHNRKKIIQSLWKFCQTNLPYILHGSSSSSSSHCDNNQIITAYSTTKPMQKQQQQQKLEQNQIPIECLGSEQNWDQQITNELDYNVDHIILLLYNMIVVRIPTIIIGILYLFNLQNGHPFICDFGSGPIEIHPAIVLGILWLILR